MGVVADKGVASDPPVDTVADPGFPRGGGANPQGGGTNLLFGCKFPENCMKMKDFGPRGAGHASLAPPLDPPMGQSSILHKKYLTEISLFDLRTCSLNVPSVR